MIPGHMKAVTWILGTVLSVVAYAATGEVSSVVGVLMLVLGMFIADQATHLAQHHEDEPPTWLECQLQFYPRYSVAVGLALAAAGLGVVLS